MPRTPIGWALTIGVPALAVAIVFALTGGGGSGSDVQARASTVCTNAQQDLERLPQSPRSISEGLEIEHGMLAIVRRELNELQELAPQASGSFQAGLAADQALLAGLSSMVARPDFVRLSLTLPGHPNLVPSWLKRWLAREHSLAAKAQAQFAQAGVPACEKSLG
jgi:hypothetical protein